MNNVKIDSWPAHTVRHLHISLAIVGLIVAADGLFRKIVSQISPNARKVWLPVVCGGRAVRLGIQEQPGVQGGKPWPPEAIAGS